MRHSRSSRSGWGTSANGLLMLRVMNYMHAVSTSRVLLLRQTSHA